MSIDAGTSEAGVVPVGAIIAYAGTDPEALSSRGWLKCTGASLARDEYPELFAAIGTANGFADQSSFNLPDCRGYFLRGVDAGSQRDPSTAGRTAPRQGANSGDKVGSVQGPATRRPDNSFAAGIPHLPPGNAHRAYKGSNTEVSSYNIDSLSLAVTEGGDAESRPLNKYVFFLIKSADQVDDQVVQLPVGAVIPFAGRIVSTPPMHYRVCDGASLQGVGEYRSLYEAIGQAHGGGEGLEFNLPDYRGHFLRGVAEDQLTDPDRATRPAPFPDREAPYRGNAGDAVGSVQGWATGRPFTPFTTSFPNLPTSGYHSDNALGNDSALYNSGSTTVALSTEGGDSETRPINVSVYWLIKIR